jgi:hypothetical protein
MQWPEGQTIQWPEGQTIQWPEGQTIQWPTLPCYSCYKPGVMSEEMMA